MIRAWNFFKQLGGSPTDKIKTAAEGGTDDEAEKATTKLMFRLSDASGSFKFTKEAEGASCNVKLLDTNDVFVIDAGYCVFVWVGKKATNNEKNNAIPYATQYLNDYKRPLSTPIVRVLEGAEFKEFLMVLS